MSTLIVGSRLFVKLAVKGLRPKGLRHSAKDVVHLDVGSSVIALSLHALERSREAWAA